MKDIALLPAAVYDIVEDGVIMYTGMTCDPEQRMAMHRKTGIATEKSRMEIVQWFERRTDAAIAESTRIDLLLPPRNNSHHAGEKRMLSNGRTRLGIF